MRTAVVSGAIGVIGCLAFVALARARSSRYALALAGAFGVFVVVNVVIVAGGYAGCARRGDCPPGLGVVQVAWFLLIVLIPVMLLGGLALLSRLRAGSRGVSARDFGLTVRIVLAVGLLGLTYLLAALVLVFFLVAAVEQRSWAAFLVFFFLGAVPVAVLVWQALRADRIALRAARARVLAPDEEPELQELVARVAAMAHLGPPRVAIAPSREANSFVVGLTDDEATLVLTSALLRRLDRGELEAVVAHELAHLANRDAIVMTLVSAPAMLGSLLFRIANGRGFFLVLLYAPIWLVGLVLLWIVSRAREYCADRAAGLITGAPERLMSALHELGGRKAKGDLRGGAAMHALCIVRTGADKWYKPDFSHPPIERRIERLAELARRIGALPS